MYLPQDINILLSVINTKLRDEYPSLQELCEEEGVDINELRQRFADAGYFYDGGQNAFKEKI